MLRPSQDMSPSHLSRISTIWSVVLQAHGKDSQTASAAQNAIIVRYAATIYRYLLKVLRDEDAADEAFQEFALQLVRGGFKHANPERGRFRDYLKVSILRIVSRYRQRRVARGGRLTTELPEGDIPEASPTELEDAFVATWRQELLERAWEGLAAEEDTSGQPNHTVLALRARQPEMKSDDMAAELNHRMQPPKPYTAAGVRKTLQRARDRFAAILLDEIAQTLENPGQDELEREVIDLGLHNYCRSALKQRFA